MQVSTTVNKCSLSCIQGNHSILRLYWIFTLLRNLIQSCYLLLFVTSCKFMSYNFMSCNLLGILTVLHFHVLQCSLSILHFTSSSPARFIFSLPTIISPWLFSLSLGQVSILWVLLLFNLSFDYIIGMMFSVRKMAFSFWQILPWTQLHALYTTCTTCGEKNTSAHL